MDILKLIATNGYIITSKELARVFGLNAAVLLGELASKHNYWEAHNKLTEDGFFIILFIFFLHKHYMMFFSLSSSYAIACFH